MNSLIDEDGSNPLALNLLTKIEELIHSYTYFAN